MNPNVHRVSSQDFERSKCGNKSYGCKSLMCTCKPLAKGNQ